MSTEVLHSISKIIPDQSNSINSSISENLVSSNITVIENNK